MSPQKRSSATKRAVLLVHGVGDPHPGDALMDFSTTLAAEEGCDLHLGGLEQQQLVDHSAPPNNGIRQFFPFSLRRGQFQGSPIIFAEAYWGEASKVSHGVIGVLRGIFSLIFGLQSIITGNRREKPPAGLEWISTKVGYFGTQVLRGPIFAANILLLSAAIALGLIALLFGGQVESMTPVWRWTVILSGVTFTAGLGLWVLLKGRRPKGFEGFVPYEEYRVLGWSCLIVAVIWPVYGACVQAHEWSAWASIGGDGLLKLFTLVSMCLLLVVLTHLCTLLVVWDDDRRRSSTASTLAFALQYGLWTFIVPILWLLVFGLLSKLHDNNATPRSLLDLFYQNMPAEGLQWLTMSFVALSFIVTWLLRQFDPKPRLIIGVLSHVVIVVATLYGFFAAIGLYVTNPPPGVQMPASLAIAFSWVPLPTDWLDWIREHEFALVTSAGVVLASSFVLSGIRIGLDIANDIANYLRFNIAFDKRNIRRGRAEFERLRPIRGRFNEVMRHLAENEEFDRLIIVAHSQGTVVALDELAHSNFGQHRNWLRKIDLRLVTMGSPLAHLFQHYFPKSYPRWNDKSYWGELTKRVSCWLNLCRSDDFVGTTIEMRESDPLWSRFVEFFVADRGGHTNYWRDRNVIDWVRLTL